MRIFILKDSQKHGRVPLALTLTETPYRTVAHTVPVPYVMGVSFWFRNWSRLSRLPLTVEEPKITAQRTG